MAVFRWLDGRSYRLRDKINFHFPTNFGVRTLCTYFSDEAKTKMDTKHACVNAQSADGAWWLVGVFSRNTIIKPITMYNISLLTLIPAARVFCGSSIPKCFISVHSTRFSLFLQLPQILLWIACFYSCDSGCSSLPVCWWESASRLWSHRDPSLLENKQNTRNFTNIAWETGGLSTPRRMNKVHIYRFTFVLPFKNCVWGG